ncbi:MAG: hypothetical protein JSV79_03835 [Armatimonadota bacterium]|nr:MAG: hypothetical protein JSV79_03835 [Armatimonadota bacterium]
MTRRSGGARRRAEREDTPVELTPEQQKAETLCKRAVEIDPVQGKMVVEDFRRGNLTLGTHTWRQRLDQLVLDCLDLEDGKKVFGGIRDFGIEWPKDPVRATVGAVVGRRDPGRSERVRELPAPSPAPAYTPDPPRPASNVFVGDGSQMEFEDGIPF